MSKKKFLFALGFFAAVSAFSQTFRVRLSQGGAFEWQSELSVQIEKYDVAQVAPIFESRNDRISIASKEVASGERILQTTIEISGENQAAALYSAGQISLESPLASLAALDNHFASLSKRVGGSKKEKFAAMRREYILRYKNSRGILEILAHSTQSEGQKIEAEPEISISIFGVKRQLKPQFFDSPEKITLGTAYNKALKRHFAAYFALYFFSDDRALRGIPPFNKRFSAF